MSYWLTIEVDDGEMSAERWRDAHGQWLTEAAITNRARTWEWHRTRWGVVLEVEFTNEQARDGFRTLPAVLAALDAVPDPVSGLLVYPGRGGGSGAGKPRKPRPAPLAGAAVATESPDLFLDTASGPVNSLQTLGRTSAHAASATPRESDRSADSHLRR